MLEMKTLFFMLEALNEVAIGGIPRQNSGIVTPKYFFASLYYNILEKQCYNYLKHFY